MANFPLELAAIRIQQPLGEFYAVSIPAKILQQVVFFDPTRIEAVDKKNFLYSLLGNQREASVERAKEISNYIETEEAAFPNSIILAANYINYGDHQEDENLRWQVI